MTRFIGQAHSLLHGSGVIRIQTDIRIGTRTDKKQGFQDKVNAVHAILDGLPRDDLVQDDDDGLGDDTEGPSMHDDHSMADAGDPNIQPGLDQHRIMPQMHAPMQANMANMGHALQQQMMHSHHDMSGHPMHQQMHPHTPHQMSHSAHPLSQSMNMQ